ncbi:hypothetical protein HMPREF1227_0242 [Streptococcus pyogenes GA41046]|nr:hypothetical protein HMPREF1227_0242 [Streptococcus pyogenes GA41046]
MKNINLNYQKNLVISIIVDMTRFFNVLFNHFLRLFPKKHKEQ